MPNEAALATAWWKTFRNQRLTVRSVVMTAIEGGSATADLREALENVAPPTYPGQPCSPHRLGKWLSRASGRPFLVDDRALIFVDLGSEGGRTWQLRPADHLHDEAALPDGFLDAVA